MEKHYEGVVEKLFTWKTLGLALGGLLLNLILARLMTLLHAPLYLDTVGSVLVAALAGALPGMVVAFLSTLLNALADPITRYYGVLAVLIGLCAAYFSHRGWLRSKWGCVGAAVCFLLIGGVLGTMMTWLLYGGIGEGATAPYAKWLYARGLPAFWAQFIADVVIDAVDKLLTMLIAYQFLRHYPRKWYDYFPLSYLYDRDAAGQHQVWCQQRCHYRVRSVHTRMVSLLAVSVLALGTLSTTVGVLYYQRAERQQYVIKASDAARQAAQLIDSRRVAAYLEQGRNAEGYVETEQKLYALYRNTTNLSYLYVYQVREDGNHVVFDLDTSKIPGDKPGARIDFDPDFVKYRPQMLLGAYIPPVLSHSKYGWLITAYYPIRNDLGTTVAYACADIATMQYVRGILSYIIQLIGVQFTVCMLILALTIQFARRRVVDPINTIVQQSIAFDSMDPEHWLTSRQWLERVPVTTGDEIETLYQTVCKVEENVAHNMIRIRQSEDIERTNRELAEAIRRADADNAAKTEFYSRMSHDMRTPMNAIIGLVKLAEHEMDTGILQDNLRKIGEVADYLLGLINDTLDMNQLEQNKLTLHPVPVHAQGIVESVFAMLIPSIHEKGVHFKTVNHGVRLDVRIMVDELRLKQIFMNLASNAIKFTPVGGTITFVLENRGESETQVQNRFILRDTGVGMSEDFMKNGMFQPFAQEHNSLTTQYAGTGLGLAIVKNLVELMGGSISVESKLGEGTTFVVDLDFKLAQSGETDFSTSYTARQNPQESLRGKHMLLAEDNTLNTEIATRLLESAGVTIEHAVNGQEAVDRFKQAEAGRFDAVLMDIRMPVMDGITATRHIRALPRGDARSVPIIAMTANAYDEDREQTRAAGMNAHLAKPIDVPEFYRILTELIAGVPKE